MTLTLSSFSQDVSLDGDPMTVYLVFKDENGRVFRLPTVQDTVARLAQILEGDYTGEPPSEVSDQATEDLKKQYPPIEEEEEEEKSDDESGATVFGGDVPPPVPVIPKPVARKKLVMTPPRTVRLEDHQGEDPEAGLPGL